MTKKPKAANVTEAIGLCLAELRHDQDMSQEAFADLVGMHRTYYSAIERGEKNVTLDTLMRITEVYRIPLSELFEDAGY